MFDLHTDTQTHTDSSRRVHVLLTLTAEDAAFTCRAPRLPLGAASPGRARTGGHHRGAGGREGQHSWVRKDGGVIACLNQAIINLY